MNLLTGIVSASGGVNNLNTSITTYSERSNTTSGISVTGADSGQIYIACHYAYNSSGISNAPGTLSGFTSLSSYAESGSIFSFNLSYKILTSDEATFTFPSVSGTNGQAIHGLVYTPLSGTATNISVASSDGYTYSISNSSISGQPVPRFGDIVLGIGALKPFTSGGGQGFPSPAVNLGLLSGGPSLGDYFAVALSKVYSAIASLPWSQSGTDTTTTLSNTFILRPTFS